MRVECGGYVRVRGNAGDEGVCIQGRRAGAHAKAPAYLPDIFDAQKKIYDYA